MPTPQEKEADRREYLKLALKLIEANGHGFQGGLINLTEDLIKSAKALEKYIKE